jgi:hypothetical protein
MSAPYSHCWFRRIMAGVVIGGIALTLGASAGPAQAQAFAAQYYSPYYAAPYRPYDRYDYADYRSWNRTRWNRGASRSGDHYGGVVHDGAH